MSFVFSVCSFRSGLKNAGPETPLIALETELLSVRFRQKLKEGKEGRERISKALDKKK